MCIHRRPFVAPSSLDPCIRGRAIATIKIAAVADAWQTVMHPSYTSEQNTCQLSIIANFSW